MSRVDIASPFLPRPDGLVMASLHKAKGPQNSHCRRREYGVITFFRTDFPAKQEEHQLFLAALAEKKCFLLERLRHPEG